MSPISMLIIWGNSFILLCLNNFPTAVIRGSFLTVTSPCPIFGLFFNIVANFHILKIRFLYPTLSCLKKTSCSPVINSRIITGINIGESNTNASSENIISKNRFITEYISLLPIPHMRHHQSTALACLKNLHCVDHSSFKVYPIAFLISLTTVSRSSSVIPVELGILKQVL